MESVSLTALVPIAEDIEEIEAVCIIDTLRRADIDVTVASVGSLQITASRGVQLIADVPIETCLNNSYDLIALPGGMPGAERLATCPDLIEMLVAQKEDDRLIGAICASPAVVLKAQGLLEGIQATCYPSFQNQLAPEQCVTDPVVVDGAFVTAQGPGVAIAFALTLIEQLCGPDKRQAVAQAMICL